MSKPSECAPLRSLGTWAQRRDFVDRIRKSRTSRARRCSSGGSDAGRRSPLASRHQGQTREALAFGASSRRSDPVPQSKAPREVQEGEASGRPVLRTEDAPAQAQACPCREPQEARSASSCEVEPQQEEAFHGQVPSSPPSRSQHRRPSRLASPPQGARGRPQAPSPHGRRCSQASARSPHRRPSGSSSPQAEDARPGSSVALFDEASPARPPPDHGQAWPRRHGHDVQPAAPAPPEVAARSSYRRAPRSSPSAPVRHGQASRASRQAPGSSHGRAAGLASSPQGASLGCS